MLQLATTNTPFQRHLQIMVRDHNYVASVVYDTESMNISGTPDLDDSVTVFQEEEFGK